MIISQFEQVVKEQNKQLAPLTDDLELQGTDLDLLCYAINRRFVSRMRADLVQCR
jgi:hypothetical protein